MDDVEAARRFPFANPSPAEPPAEYAQLRETAPVSRVVLPTGHIGWVVTGHAEVKAVCTDARFSKQAVTAPDAPRLLPVARGSKSLVTMDPPEHTRLRALANRAFTPRRIDALQPRIDEITHGLLDAMIAQGPPADAIAAVALPLPITVICDLLGVPVDDQPRFREWSDKLLAVSAPAGHSGGNGARNGAENGADSPAMAAGMNLMGYLGELIERKRRDPVDDLLTALITARDQDDRLSEEELRAFGMTLLVAGYHTTTAAIAHALLHLLAMPGWPAQLTEAALPAAVEELLRYSQVAGGFGAMRIAVEDVELADALICRGDPVIPAFGSANRDAAVFDAPDELDLGRSPNPHLAFGVGVHYCLGAQLARVELRVLLGALAQRLPGLALAVPATELSWQPGTAFPRPVTMPVCW
jgi:cytochrome P450